MEKVDYENLIVKSLCVRTTAQVSKRLYESFYKKLSNCELNKELKKRTLQAIAWIFANNRNALLQEHQLNNHYFSVEESKIGIRFFIDDDERTLNVKTLKNLRDFFELRMKDPKPHNEAEWKSAISILNGLIKAQNLFYEMEKNYHRKRKPKTLKLTDTPSFTHFISLIADFINDDINPPSEEARERRTGKIVMVRKRRFPNRVFDLTSKILKIFSQPYIEIQSSDGNGIKRIPHIDLNLSPEDIKGRVNRMHKVYKINSETKLRDIKR